MPSTLIISAFLLAAISLLSFSSKCATNEILTQCSLDIILSKHGVHLFPIVTQELEKYQVYSASLSTSNLTLTKHLFALKTKLLHKHSTCSTLIIDLRTTFVGVTELSYDIFQVFTVNKYNPNYALVLQIEQIFKNYERNFLLAMRNSMLSSIFFIWIVQPDRNIIGIYCIPCVHENFQHSLVLTYVDKLKDTQRVWSGLNRNMRGIPIEPFPYFKVNNSDVCHPYTSDDFNTVPFVCVSLLAGEVFNYSVTFRSVHKSPSYESYAQISSYVIGNSKLIQMLLYPSYVVYEWIPIGTAYKPFHFVIFTQLKYCASYAFLLSPFRLTTWIFISSAIVSISTLIYLQVGKRNKESLFSVVLWVSFILIEKSSIRTFTKAELN